MIRSLELQPGVGQDAARDVAAAAAWRRVSCPTGPASGAARGPGPSCPAVQQQDDVTVTMQVGFPSMLFGVNGIFL